MQRDFRESASLINEFKSSGYFKPRLNDADRAKYQGSTVEKTTLQQLNQGACTDVA